MSDDKIDDPQLWLYYNRPKDYATIARKIDLLEKISYRRCTGNGCDEGHPCPRHQRAMEVVDRFLRAKEKRQ